MAPTSNPISVSNQPPTLEKDKAGSPQVPDALAAVQETLLKLEMDLRVLGFQVGDVQPPGPADHPQGRVAGKVSVTVYLSNVGLAILTSSSGIK